MNDLVTAACIDNPVCYPQGRGGGVQKFRSSRGAPTHGAKRFSRFSKFQKR